MDDNKKQPGPRDISDLKARLGLKKTGAMPAVAPAPNTTPAAGQPAQPAPQAVPPPSGFGAPAPSPFAAPPQPEAPQPAQPRAIPSPFAPRQPDPAPQPAAPAPVDPRRDPFAAQQQQAAANLAAFYGLGQQLPGSASDVPDAEMKKPTPWGRIGMIAAICAVPFIVGTWIGSITRSRSDYNVTTDQAGQLTEEVNGISKQLNEIADTLNASPETRKGGVDLAMTAKLGALDLKKPDTNKIFHTNYQNMEPTVVEQLMEYYDGTIKLFDEVGAHAKKTDNDKDAIARMAKEGAKSDKNYGVIVEPQGGLTLAKFVEVGAPQCADPSKTDCSAADLKGFQYRLDSGSGWGTRPVKGKPEAIVMPLQQTPLFKAVAAGNPDFLAVKDYARRVAEIRTQLVMLQNQQKDLLAGLKKVADRPKLLTF